MNTRLVVGLITILLLPCGAALGEVFRWVDDNGRVHYTDKPPPGQGERVEVTTSPEPPAATASDRDQNRQRLLRMYERERQERKTAKAQQDKDRAELKRNCDEAADTLRRYLSGGVLYEIKPDGSRRFFSAAAKDREVADLRNALQRHCGRVPADLQPAAGR